MANPDAVPAGKYGKAALQALGVWQAVERQVARADNVRAALVLVARGEAPFGIVYRTDALAEPGVRIVDTFPRRQPPADRLSAGADRAAARRAGGRRRRLLAYLRRRRRARRVEEARLRLVAP